MTEQDSPRNPGRPRDPAKVEAILTASWRLFLARGVEAVTVDTIASEAAVSKGTVYAYFPDKRALFQEGVRREMAKIEAAQGLRRDLPANATLEDVLIAFGTGIMTFLTSDGAVDFYSQLSGELRRDPELARMFYESGPGRTHANLASILRSPLAKDLAIDDADEAAEILFGMWQGVSNYRLALGIDREAIVDRIPANAANGVRRFMTAYATSSNPPAPRSLRGDETSV